MFSHLTTTTFCPCKSVLATTAASLPSKWARASITKGFFWNLKKKVKFNWKLLEVEVKKKIIKKVDSRGLIKLIKMKLFFNSVKSAFLFVLNSVWSVHKNFKLVSNLVQYLRRKTHFYLKISSKYFLLNLFLNIFTNTPCFLFFDMILVLRS